MKCSRIGSRGFKKLAWRHLPGGSFLAVRWAHLMAEQYRTKIAELIAEIEAEAAAEREQTGSQPLGVKAILRQKPTDQPVKTKTSPAPLFHAFSRKVRKELYEAYGCFVAAFREAADKLKDGDRNARFPTGSFPPHLPFVSHQPPRGLILVPG